MADKDDILVRLVDLHEQATQEKSHHYVGKVCLGAIAEIRDLRQKISQIKHLTS